MKYNNSYQIKYLNAVPSYLESQPPKPFYHADLKKNLEGVVLDLQPMKDKGILERLFSDKTKTLKSTVKALLTEIELRENLNSHILNNIDDDICRQHTYLGHLKVLKPQYSLELAKNVYKQKMQLEGNVLELEEQKRKEYLECWRDLMFLKKYLHSALKDYWDLVKKQEMLGADSNSFLGNEISYEEGKGRFDHD